MPGGINKTADFYTLAGITIRDGIWSQTARTISASRSTDAMPVAAAIRRASVDLPLAGGP